MNALTLSFLLWLGNQNAIVSPDVMVSAYQGVAQDTTSLEQWKQRAHFAMKESLMQKRLAEQMAEKAANLTKTVTDLKKTIEDQKKLIEECKGKK